MGADGVLADEQVLPMRALSQPLLSRASTWRSRGDRRDSGESGARSLGDHAAGQLGQHAPGTAPSPSSTAPATRSTVLAP